MSDRLPLLRRLGLLMLVGLLAAVDVQAQGWYRPFGGDYYPPPGGRQGRQDRPPPRQFTDPDRAAHAAREATGGRGRVLGIQGIERDGRPGYRVRTLEPDGRVRNFHFDPDSGGFRD